MGAPKGTSADEPEEDALEVPASGQRHEVLAIVSGALTVLFALALASYNAQGDRNWVGPAGQAVAGLLVTAFGIGAWVLPLELALATARLFSRRTNLLGVATVASTLVFVLVGCAMLHLAVDDRLVFGGHLPGGLLGEVLGEVLRSLLGLVGAFVVGISVLLITLVLRTPLSLADLGRAVGRALRRASSAVADAARAVWAAWCEAKELERAEREAAEEAHAPRIVPGATAPGARAPEPDGDTASPHAETGARADPGSPAPAAESAPAEPASAEPQERAPAGAKDASAGHGPRIVAPSPDARRKPPSSPSADGDTPQAGTGRTPQPASAEEGFRPVPTTVLEEPRDADIRVDAQTLKHNATRLVEELSNYGVKGRVDEIHPGPVVTMYEFEPQSGTKVSKIAGLGDDLAMALAAEKVRIVAPIPGKARVGFELPNEHRQTVTLREVLEDERWEKLDADLPMALGNDIAGQPVYCDLASMPHLLVAGATGAGKSVGLNVMLASLLAKKTPEQVRFLMIDPKAVELSVFDGIPHMLLPVVTDMKKAAQALKWAVDEMERRYQLLADAGVRSIVSYNERVDKVRAGTMSPDKLKAGRRDKKLTAPEGAAEIPDDAPPEKLPHVVVVVDELADLMMVAAKDVEACIARLAQKARAAGIHVILATQRPSVDVITGMIKANFPSRIAFKTSQPQDSKTILGRHGAEHLLGKGDMLMLPPGSSDLRRVHCAYISEDEVQEVCDFLRSQGDPVYDENILKPREEDEDGGDDGSGEDPLYDRAVRLVADAGYCSISYLQRQLEVGYNKAAKLVERMEVNGVVSPASGKAGGRREVLIEPH